MSLAHRRRVTMLVLAWFCLLLVTNLSEPPGIAGAFNRDEPPTYYGDPPPGPAFQPNLTNQPTAPGNRAGQTLSFYPQLGILERAGLVAAHGQVRYCHLRHLAERVL